MDKPRRQRTGRPKTRTGCLTCKRRRVKCDERKPFCVRCQSFEVVCDGYQAPPKRATAGQMVVTSKTSVIHKPGYTPSILGSHPYQPLFSDEQQYRYFRVFCEQTVKSLSGFFDKVLWSELVLQACETNPSIRHAIVAIGALDKTLESVPQARIATHTISQHNISLSGEVHYKFAIQHYAAALRIMRDAISEKRHDLRTTLIACLLAVCFELFHGNMQSAQVQAESGLKLINQWLQEAKGPVKHVAGLKSPVPSVVDDELMQAFARLDIHAVAFKASRGVEISPLAKRDIQEICQGMPSSFSSFTEARAHWEDLLRQALHWTVGAYFWCSEMKDQKEAAEGISGTPIEDGKVWISNSSLEERRKILDQQHCYIRSLELWLSSFSPLLDKARTSADRHHKAGATSLYLRFRAAHIGLHGSMFKEETQFDDRLHAFLEVISLAKSALNDLDECESNRKIIFTFDSGFVGPLYVVAVLCRDPSIRRQAIALLEAFPRREGVWDSVLAAKAATIIMNIEEEGLEGGSIPEHARIRGIRLTSDLQKRTGELQYFVPKLGEDGVFLVRKAEFCW